jgi:hypothetical protein
MQLDPRAMQPVGTVDPRFQSFNVEMVEVTGGRFWAPYAAIAAGADRYQERAPIDLANPTLRRLAAALGPAYMRVSGTWANKTDFVDTLQPRAAPPPGFEAVLTHERWRAAVDFAAATDARIMTSVAVSRGTRDAGGVWQAERARRFLAFDSSLGGHIAALEFMNEPSAPALADLPEGYDAEAYARDFAAFRAAVRETAPQALVFGPSSIGDRADAVPEEEGLLSARRLLERTAGGLDGLSYHHYGAASRRCAGDGWWPQTRAEDALGAAWLDTTVASLGVYRALRDRYLPGKPLWLTETADAVCGGNPWAATFLDSFRYCDQLGRLAQGGVQVVMHNTLAASDYGLLDESDFTPRPNYWAALLWHRLMGRTVRDPAVRDPTVPPRPGLRVYAHDRADGAPGVTALLLNLDQAEAAEITLTSPAALYTLHAATLRSRTVLLNAAPLRLTAAGEIPLLLPRPVSAGVVALPPASLSFAVLEG